MSMKRVQVPLLALLLVASSSGCTAATYVSQGQRRELRPPGVRSSEVDERPKLLILAIDGIDRKLIYDMLRGGQLPHLAEILGGQEDGRFPHAHFDETVLSVLPSCTLPAWASVFSGVPPSEHGVTGNEFFLRESLTLAAPAPTTFDETEPSLRVYTTGYANRLLAVPSVYERLRDREPGISIWVTLSQFFSGADLLLLPKWTVVETSVLTFLKDELKAQGSRDPFQAVDESALDAVMNELDGHAPPDVLTVYLPGADLFAHVAGQGPDEARTKYLKAVVDPKVGALWKKLAEKKSVENRYVLLVSDHGHTEVIFDYKHALTTRDDDSPPAVLRAAGFKVRPFQLDVGSENDFQAVLTYQGAMAFVYLADRSTAMKDVACNWTRPPRFKEDVLAAADAFFKANETGLHAPSLKGTLDMVLARVPRPYGDVDEPFQVYVGNGLLEPVGKHLAANPHPDYVALEERLRELGVGRFGERAGDVVLIAHNGDRRQPSERYYFAQRYRSWHGSPSRQDSEVPFIVAHPGRSAAEIESVVRAALGPAPRLQRVADVILQLRSAP